MALGGLICTQKIKSYEKILAPSVRSDATHVICFWLRAYGISAFFLKITASTISPYLLVMIKFSFTHDIFSDSCKIAKVVPIYKSGNKSDTTNYRPISILTCFSQIFEKLCYKRIFNFLEKYKVLLP